MTDHASLVELLRQRARQQPDDCAYVLVSNLGQQEQSVTFATLERRAQVLADRLAARVRPGERVLLMFPTGIAFIVAYFACLIAGAIAVPVMPPRRNATRDASAAIIADCTPRLALVSPELIEVMRADLKQRLALGGIPYLPVALDELDQAAPQGVAAARVRREDIAFLQYTSGSTATPKGVMVSHANLLENLEMIRADFGNHSGSTHVSWLPLYHDMGLILNVLQSMYLGALCVLMTPVGFMHRPLEWLRSIHRYRGEVAAAPNFAFDLCVDRFRPQQMEGIDLSCWKLACNGAEPIRAETLRRFAETFAPYGFDAKALYPAYGLAEATLFVAAGRRGRGPTIRDVDAATLQAGRMTPAPDARNRRMLVGCGRVVSGLGLAIVDPSTRRRRDTGSVGEIWIRGPSVAQGYWGRTLETAASFQAEIEGEAEPCWLRTGDLGCVDADGEIYIVGRLKDVIIIRGVNHYPQDIEATVAASHPALRRDFGAVFAVPDEQGNDRLVVVQEVERRRHDATTTEDICGAIRAAVANEHEVMARTIVLIEPGTLPKTTSGKIQRARTRQLWSEGNLALWTERGQPAAEAMAQ